MSSPQQERLNGGPPAEENAEVAFETGLELSLEDLLYSSSSYHAIATPVSITMILAALAVTYINTEETIAQGEAALSAAYEAFDNNGSTTAATLGLSLLNALIIVSAIGAMTFGIVLLYKYRCMKILIGYMIFSSSMLLGFLGGVMFDVAINKYEINIDVFSYYFTLYNFALVGTTSIFWQKGIPMYVTQGYLIATSVILAWQLSHFDDWTSWTLLIMLALYDLCAVLTPCGPLKALVNLMQREDSPQMPGLLYEAELPAGARRPPRRQQAQRSASAPMTAPSPASTEGPVATPSQASIEITHTHVAPNNPEEEDMIDLGPPPTIRIPFAIAKLYKLHLTEPMEAPARRNSFTPLLEDGEATSPNTSSAPLYTTEQLLMEVEAILPRGGGRIELVLNASGDVRYRVTDRHGELKRILFVNEAGRVMEERRRSDDDDDDEKSNSIKLGLGDFIFYSVLVAKASQYSFTTFVACMLVILAGLGGTLILLAVYRHALPALPISIFLGVLFYVLTRLLIEPWVQEIFILGPLYV